MDGSLGQLGGNNSQQSIEGARTIHAWEAMLRLHLNGNDKIDEQEYEKLFQWIVDLFLSYATKATLCGRKLQLIVMTRRCAVLVELCMQMARFYQENLKANRPSFFQNVDLAELLRLDEECCVTDAAAMAFVPKWLALYNTNNSSDSFPLIVIFDDLMLYGRTCNTLLNQIEQALRIQWLENYSKTDASALLHDFVESVYIEIYTRCERSLLLYSRYYNSYHARQTYTLAQCRKLSHKIALAVASSSVCNVSSNWGLIGHRMSKVVFPQISLKNFFYVKTICNDAEMFHFLLFYPSIQCPTIIGSIRVKYSATTHQPMVMPCFISANISFSCLAQTAEVLLSALKDTACGEFLRACNVVLPMQMDRMHNCRLADAVELILSKMLYERFLTQCGLDKNNFTPNSRHLARCFGLEESVIDQLYEEKLGDNTLLQLDKFLSILSAESDFLWEDTDDNISGHEENMFRLLQEEVADLGLASEKHAFHLYLQKAPFSNNVLSSINAQNSLQKLFDNTVHQYQKKHFNERFSRLQMVAYLFHLVDQGMAGFRWNSSLSNTGNLCTEVTAGEPSLFLKPMLYVNYLMVLNDIQEKCQLNKTPVKLELHKLEESIGLENEQEKKQLSEELALFIEDLNNSGQKASDWLFPIQFSVSSLKSIQDDDALSRSIKKIQNTKNRRYKAQTWEQLDRMLAYHLV